MTYFIGITRFTLAFVFLYSFSTKLYNFAVFEQTVKSFQLLPMYLHRPIALTLILGEFIVIVAAVLGGNWLFFCFGLAIFLLVLFIYALNAVLKRNIRISCNCFGVSEQKVSPHDIWRNMGIISIACFGLISLFLNKNPISPSILNLLFCGMVALVLSLLLINMRELLELII